MTLDKNKIAKLLTTVGSSIEAAMLLAFIKVESGGKAFEKDGKLVIQFEPYHFRKRTDKIINNIVDVQSKEWIAFNEAFAINPNAAMESTSIGLPQIMGFHWKRLGYKSVGEMWDDFKKGEDQQILALIKFIETDLSLSRAMINKDFTAIANIYNGADWANIAKKYGREPYPIAIKNAYLANGGKV